MPKKSKKKDGCGTYTITFCGAALKMIKKRQGEAMINTGSTISIETAVNKLLLDK